MGAARRDWDVLGEEEENVCLSILLLGECCLLCCPGPARALGFGGFGKQGGDTGAGLWLEGGWFKVEKWQKCG